VEFYPLQPLLFYLAFFFFFLPHLARTHIANDDIKNGVELGISEKYDEAIQLFRALADANPADPGPHFFLATIWQSKMMDFETQLWQKEFEGAIEQTLSLAESRLNQNQYDLNDQFFHASALAYKSFQISREGNYLKGLRLAFKAVDGLEAVVAHDSSYFDAYLGIGSYLYWRSYLTRHFTWLPFFKDQRQRGIDFIRKAHAFGSISRWAALSNLAWIYIQEEQYEDAIQCAQKGLDVFPNSRFFLWPLGDAQFHNGDFSKALETYQVLLESVIGEEFNNHYNEIVLHLKIGKCWFELGEMDQSLQHAKRVLEIKAHQNLAKRLADKRKQARSLITKINEHE
jgi:tetratricopeptide (TPR) repeat protein